MSSDDKKPADAYIKDKGEFENEGDEKHQLDDSRVKFINGGANSETVVVVGGREEDEFAGMGKEELMKFSDDPFWVRLRLVMFVAFWLIWVGMLVAAIIIIVLAPKCPPKPLLQWWETDVMYQIYPRSFKDTNGDGAGDLKGILEKINDGYLPKKLAVRGLVLGPIFKTENVDWGNDVTDFKEIQGDLGTMDDFKQLVKIAHKQRMKVVLDLPIGQTSNKHPWFIESSKSKDNEYADYYVWKDPKPTGAVPNNWLSQIGNGAAWTKVDARGQYYYHLLLEEEPTLNLLHPKVREEIKSILEFWLDKGVDGFRILGTPYFVATNFDKNEESNGKTEKNSYDNLDHKYTANQDGVFNVTTDLQKVISDYWTKTSVPKVLMAETDGASLNFSGKLYDSVEMPINTQLLKLDKDCNGKCLRTLVKNWLDKTPTGNRPNWMTGTSHTHRIATRTSVKMTSVMNTLLMTLPGASISYYGEEIGMQNIDPTLAELEDPFGKKFPDDFKIYSRDLERSPMQWTSKQYAGFSSNNTWLPLQADYTLYNVNSEQATGSNVKFLDVYMALQKLREAPSFQWGNFYDALVDTNVFSFVRQATGHPGFLVALNVGTSASTDDYTKAINNLVPDIAEVVFTTMNMESDDFKIGKQVKLKSILLRPGEGLIVKFPWKA